MKITLLLGEVFYNPQAFFRKRENDKNILHFMNLFYLFGYVIIAANILWIFNLPASFLNFFVFVLVFYLVGFIKTCIFSAFLNNDEAKQRVSIKKVWLINAISLYPIYIFFPLAGIVSYLLGFISPMLTVSVFFIAILLIFVNINFFKTKLIREMLGRYVKFVWFISLAEVIIVFSLIYVYIMIALQFVSLHIKSIFAGLM